MNIREKTLRKIKPGKKELLEEKKAAVEIMKKIARTKGKHLAVEWCGSSARNTHLKGDRDIDIFVLYPKSMARKEFEIEGLRTAKSVFSKGKWVKEFAEHPYIRGNYNGFEVDVVPGYYVEDASLLQSAVDRTPFHNRWLKKHQKEKHKDDTRLLKAFLKGMDAYGAKLKFNSVPGYLTELLIIKYGSFSKTLKAISEWEKNELIQFSWEYEKKGAVKKFNHHLIVVDPTDKKRNVAAALSFNQFARIIAASRAYLKKPSEKFFFKDKRKPLSLGDAKKLAGQKNVVALKVAYPKKTVPDIVYGQIRRFGKKMAKHLEIADFKVMRFDQYTDEKNFILFVFEIQEMKLEMVKKQFGPETANKKHSDAFLKQRKKFVSGPWIEEGRWAVEKKRKHWNVTGFLKDYSKKEAKKEKMPLKKSLLKTSILNEKKLLGFYKKDTEFARFFSRFLKGREEFFEY